MKLNSGIVIYILLLLFIFFISCSKNKKKEREDIKQEIEGITQLVPNDSIFIVDLDNAQMSKLLYLSDFVKNVHIIPLEANSSILIGRIHKLIIHDEYIFILDKSYSKSLFVFNKDGEFVRKIGNIGKGPGEYVNISDFTLDLSNNIIYLLDSHTQRISWFYISSGKYINSVRIKNDFIRSFRIQFAKDKIYTDAYLPSDFKDKSFLLREINKETGEQETLWMSSFRYNKDWNELFFNKHNEFISHKSDSIKFNQIFMDTVVLVTPTKVTPYMAIKSKNLLTTKDLQATAGKPANERFNSLITVDKIHGINDYLEFEKYIYFQFKKKNSIYTVLYNKANKNTCIAEALIDDIIYTKNLANTILPHFYFADDKGFYGILQPQDTERFQDLAKRGYLSDYMIKIYDTLKISENSNPIIFYYEYKD